MTFREIRQFFLLEQTSRFAFAEFDRIEFVQPVGIPRATTKSDSTTRGLKFARPRNPTKRRALSRFFHPLCSLSFFNSPFGLFSSPLYIYIIFLFDPLVPPFFLYSPLSSEWITFSPFSHIDSSNRSLPFPHLSLFSRLSGFPIPSLLAFRCSSSVSRRFHFLYHSRIPSLSPASLLLLSL